MADLRSTDASTETEEKLYLRLQVKPGAQALWFYSVDGKTYYSALSDNVAFQAKPGRWVGATLGLFSLQTIPTSDFSSLNKSANDSSSANDSKPSNAYADFGPVHFQR
nr:hypothetical protein [uncultured Undibacterium sp.]